MNTYYFTIGKFCPEGMGYNYNGHGAEFVIVDAETFCIANDKVKKFAESIYGKAEYKDMYYGDMAWSWKITPHTKYTFDREYRIIYNKLKYTTIDASVLFTGETPTAEKFNELHHRFSENYPVIKLY